MKKSTSIFANTNPTVLLGGVLFASDQPSARCEPGAVAYWPVRSCVGNFVIGRGGTNLACRSRSMFRNVPCTSSEESHRSGHLVSTASAY